MMKRMQRDAVLLSLMNEIIFMGEDTSIIVGPVKEKIRSFERKHGCNLETFEERLKQLPEDFERWDDFIEWKAYADSLKDLEPRITDISYCRPKLL